MSAGWLVDLDPPPARERRWPFYVGWTLGGVVVAAVMLSHLPAPSIRSAPAPVVGPIMTATPAPTAISAATFIIQRGPQGTPTRVAPGPVGPARP